MKGTTKTLLFFMTVYYFLNDFWSYYLKKSLLFAIKMKDPKESYLWDDVIYMC